MYRVVLSCGCLSGCLDVRFLSWLLNLVRSLLYVFHLAFPNLLSKYSCNSGVMYTCLTPDSKPLSSQLYTWLSSPISIYPSCIPLVPNLSLAVIMVNTSIVSVSNPVILSILPNPRTPEPQNVVYVAYGVVCIHSVISLLICCSPACWLGMTNMFGSELVHSSYCNLFHLICLIITLACLVRCKNVPLMAYVVPHTFVVSPRCSWISPSMFNCFAWLRFPHLMLCSHHIIANMSNVSPACMLAVGGLIKSPTSPGAQLSAYIRHGMPFFIMMMF